MKTGYFLAGASILHAVSAIPAYITTVFDCPDAVTITQTVYPPGWTATGPIYTSAASPPVLVEDPAATYCEAGQVTTSWETEYATKTVVYSELGMYQGPPGCPSEIIAYMPTTVTCSEPRTTGWVGYVSDIACASCTATTLAGLEPSYNVASGVTTTYVTVWTEVYIEGGASTYASAVGSQWIATGIPTGVYPYWKSCSTGGGGGNTPQPQQNPTPSVGGGYSYTHSPGAYPSIDYNNPDVFHGGESIPIQSQGYTPGPSPNPTAAPQNNNNNNQPDGPYSWTKGHYPSIDYNNPDYFKGGPGTGSDYNNQAPNTYNNPTNTYYQSTVTYATGTNTGTNTAARPATAPSGSYFPINYSDSSYFRPIQSSVGIDSKTEKPTYPPATATYTAATSYTANYASVDNNAPENFRPLSTGITIVSLTGSQSNASPTAGSTSYQSVNSAAYPTIDYSDPNVFKGLDPNAGAQPTTSAA